MGINFCPLLNILTNAPCKNHELRLMMDFGSLLFGKNGGVHLSASGTFVLIWCWLSVIGLFVLLLSFVFLFLCVGAELFVL